MKSIIQELKEGTVRERLSLIADIVSISGISLGAVIAGALSLTNTMYVGNLIFSSFLSLLSLAFVCFILVLFIFVSEKISSLSSFGGLIVFLCQAALWLFFVVAYYIYILCR